VPKRLDPDAVFFMQHPTRVAHIRLPQGSECFAEFRSLGDHLASRRRILLWREPADNPHYDPDKPKILKVPLLAFGDETIEDSDDTLLPILRDIMVDARRKMNN
jgi:hypothetical protein